MPVAVWKFVTSHGGFVFVADGLLMTAPLVAPVKLKSTCDPSGTGLPLTSVTVAALTVVSVPLLLSPEPLVNSARARFDGMPTPGVPAGVGVPPPPPAVTVGVGVATPPPGVNVAPAPGVALLQPEVSSVQP